MYAIKLFFLSKVLINYFILLLHIFIVIKPKCMPQIRVLMLVIILSKSVITERLHDGNVGVSVLVFVL